MEGFGNHDIMERILMDKKLVADFTSNMQLITKQTGVELNIDISKKSIAWMIPGDTRVFFNPVYTLMLIQAIQQQRAKEFGISENFTFDINHLSQLVLHEINHMINHSQLKMSDKRVKFEGNKMNMIRYQQSLHKKYGRDFQNFENTLEDIDVNNHATIIQAPVFEQAKQDIYHHIAFPSGDFSQMSLAEQFAWTILRESMLPDEKCIVDPRVRECVDYLSEPGEALEKLRNPSLSYDEQLPVIHRLYEDYYLKFKEEDEKQDKEKQDENKNEDKDETNGNEQQGNSENLDSNNQGNQSQNGHSNQGNATDEQNELGNKSGQSSQTPSQDQDNSSGGQNGQTSSSQSQQNESPESQTQGGGQSQNNTRRPMLLPHIFENFDGEGNNILENLEKSLNKKEGTNKDQESSTETDKTEDNLPTSQDVCRAIGDTIQEILQQQKEAENKSPEERNLEATIKQKWGIDGPNSRELREIKRRIKEQEKLKEGIKKIKNSRGQSVYDKITKDIFSRIVQTRRWKELRERHARPFSEGGQLDSQNFVEGIIDWKAGDDDPRILKQEYKESKEKQKAGGFSITFILDGSASMRGEKNRQQSLSTLLMLYALQQLNQDIKLDGGDMEDFLISTQVMMFCGYSTALLKDRGKELDIKDMIEVTQALQFCGGGRTNAADAINGYYEQVSKPFGKMSQKQYQERREKVKEGKLKEIVFVLSDGEFHDDPTNTIKKLRKMGIIVCGIGITNEGRYMLNYFGEKSSKEEKNKQGFGIVCEDTGNLGNVLNELLVQHLEDSSIVG